MSRHVPFDEERALSMYREGKLDQEIADAVGSTRPTIASWRYRRGFASNAPPLKSGTRPEVTVDIPPGLRSAARREPPSDPGGRGEANADNSSGGVGEMAARNISSSGSLPPPPAPETKDAPAERYPEVKKAPEPKEKPAERGPEGTIDALRQLCEAAGAVTLELNVGGCSVRVQAESLEQLGAVARFLGAITGVSDPDTGGGGK